MTRPLIVFFTDFGHEGPYLGQMSAVLRREAPEAEVINLFADAPAFEPQLSAYLMPAYVGEFPPGTIFLCVVDPGVGGDRRPLVLNADGNWYVGPDNGLFEMVLRRAVHVDLAAEIVWKPRRLSASFHGRDLFAPVAAELAHLTWGAMPDGDLARPTDPLRFADWPDELDRVAYIDRFGNALTGRRAASLSDGAVLRVGDVDLPRLRTFADAPVNMPFWFENANGLVEIAVNRGRADESLDLAVGDAILVTTP
ncbi:MAG: SAM-dependent chlorinase/fluorinase [Rhodobacterales bacterium]|nr:SAM-dependent chlorinase/fluorinase [Rhodobacterales bacterium]